MAPLPPRDFGVAREFMHDGSVQIGTAGILGEIHAGGKARAAREAVDGINRVGCAAERVVVTAHRRVRQFRLRFGIEVFGQIKAHARFDR